MIGSEKISPNNDKPKFLVGAAGILLLAFLVVGGQSLPVQPPKSEYPEISELVILEGNSLMVISSPNYIRSMIYQTLIECLAKYESSNNPKAVGDHKTSFGLLQFKKNTFQKFCVEKYNLRNDIFDPEIQKVCADLMLGENFNNIHHWSVRWRCLK